MFNILNHQENANQKSPDVSPYTGHKDIGKNLRRKQVLGRIWRKIYKSPLLMGLQVSKTTLEISKVVPEKTALYYRRTLVYPSWAYTQKILQLEIKTHIPLCS